MQNKRALELIKRLIRVIEATSVEMPGIVMEYNPPPVDDYEKADTRPDFVKKDSAGWVELKP